MRPLRRLRNEKGLSLTDLIVTSSILTWLSGVILGTVQFQGKVHGREFARAVGYAESRVGFQQLARELRLAGADPQETGLFGVTVHKAAELWFTYDKNGDGLVDPGTSETRGFRYANGTLSRWTGGTAWRPVVTGIAEFSFSYRNSNGNSLSESSSERVAVVEAALTPLVAGSPPGEGAMLSVAIRNRR